MVPTALALSNSLNVRTYFAIKLILNRDGEKKKRNKTGFQLKCFQVMLHVPNNAQTFVVSHQSTRTLHSFISSPGIIFLIKPSVKNTVSNQHETEYHWVNLKNTQVSNDKNELKSPFGNANVSL